MELNQLAFVLDFVDTSIHDTELLPAYNQLITAVANVSAANGESVAAVHAARKLVIGLHETIDPRNFQFDQLAILDQYDASGLLGAPAIARIQNSFTDNFLDPAGLLAELRALHDETLLLAEKMTLLLKGLDPILTAESLVPAVEGDVMPVGLRSLPAETPRNPLSRIKQQLARRNQSSSVIRADEVPLSTKLIAAAPVVIAAAGKALEAYRVYNDKRQPVSRPTTPQAAEQSPPIQPVRGYSRISYSHSVYYHIQDD